MSDDREALRWIFARHEDGKVFSSITVNAAMDETQTPPAKAEDANRVS